MPVLAGRLVIIYQILIMKSLNKISFNCRQKKLKVGLVWNPWYSNWIEINIGLSANSIHFLPSFFIFDVTAIADLTINTTESGISIFFEKFLFITKKVLSKVRTAKKWNKFGIIKIQLKCDSVDETILSGFEKTIPFRFRRGKPLAYKTFQFQNLSLIKTWLNLS